MKKDSSTSGISPSLTMGLDHHHAGRLTDAEQIYRAILKQNPDHADALHLLGMLLHSQGKNDDAEKLIRRAISIQPRQPVYHSNLGIVLAAMGKVTDAIAEYRLADSISPASPETLNNLGVALHSTLAINAAIDCFKRAVILRPDYADARNNLLALLNLPPKSPAANHALGDLLHEANKSADAISFYRQAIAQNHESAETHNNLGNALFATGEPAEAFLHYQMALKIAPDFPQAQNNLANVLKELERLDDSIAAYHRAVELQPNAPEPLSNLGNALRDAGRWDDAMECYRKALLIRPDHPPTHNNIGNAWCERGNWTVAISEYEIALANNPDYGDAINNLGTALEETGQRDRAMQCYKRAKELSPNAVSPPWNIALLQLLQGDYKNGWPGYENRWRQKKQCKSWRDFKQPMVTDVSQLKGKTILLHAEQGFGDAIQFCRYATLAAEQGAKVLLECPPKLARLFASLKGVSQIIARGEELPEFDLHCPLMSLPMVFGTILETVPAQVPYLFAAEKDVDHWRLRFVAATPASPLSVGEPRGDAGVAATGEIRVGLVWAGQSTHQKDRHRSLSLCSFKALDKIPNIQFYSLQVGEAAAQAKSPPRGMPLIDWTDDLHDFADTAALISQLDLVITVDTAVCHLAAALGKPVWALIAFQPDWRWLLDREDSPWYPSIRLFRQPVPEDWATPLQQLATALRKKIDPRRHVKAHE